MKSLETVYLDNAATTPLRTEVVEAMTDVLLNNYGNPSSSHSFGRAAKTLLETSRKTVAKIIGATASEIIFTSSATEATNWVLLSAVKNLGVQRIITAATEHHATLHTVAVLKEQYNIVVDYVKILPNGNLCIHSLQEILQNGSEEKTLVSLMHVNNETGEMLPLARVAHLCKANNALFHCDAVQSIGKEIINLNEVPVDFLVASAHKFHGPKGAGFVFIRKKIVLQPLIYGGEQEKGFRAGTEGLHQIVGMAKALEISYDKLDKERLYITDLKNYCIIQLQENFPEAMVIGKETFYNIINVILPFDAKKTAMLLFALDMKGIAVSRGSACQSGSSKPSHVLASFLSEENQFKPNIRISFSHFNTKKDIDLLIDALKSA